MNTFEIVQTIILAFLFGGLGAVLIGLWIARVLARRRSEDDDEDEEDDHELGWINAENVCADRTREGWLSFTRTWEGENGKDEEGGTPYCLPIKKIEYVARRENGRAYLGCYRVREKRGFYYCGYDTVESYEEIIQRIKGEARHDHQ